MLKPIFILTLFCLFAPPLAAQQYLPATITLASGKAMEGGILAEDWRVTPQSIKFKGSDGQARNYTAGQLQAFEAQQADGQRLRYETKTLVLHVSPTRMGYLDIGPKPILETKTVLVQVLLKGKVSLYQHTDGLLQMNLFVEKDSLETLLYKKYRPGDSDKNHYNDTYFKEYTKYRVQLKRITFDCPALVPAIDELKWTQKAVLNLLKTYLSTCGMAQPDYAYTPKKWKATVSLMAAIGRTGYGFSDNHTDYIDFNPFKFGGFPTLAGGLGIHIPLPKSNERVAMGIELLAQHDQAEGADPAQTLYDPVVRVNTTYFRANILGRYYLSAGKYRPNLSLGFPFSFLIGNNSKRVLNNDLGFPTPTPRVLPLLGRYQRVEVGALAGIGLQVGRFSLDARYSYNDGFSGSNKLHMKVHRLLLVVGVRVL